MELSILETRGMPPDAILSIRAGMTRCQGLVNPGQALCFPTLPLNAGPLKIDVLSPVGGCRVAMRAEDSEYDVTMDSDRGKSTIGLRFAVREAPQYCGKSNSEFRKISSQKEENSDGPCSPRARLSTAIEAREYLDRHNLVNYVQEMLKYVISEKPEDPIDFMVGFLTRGHDSHRTPPASAPAGGGIRPPYARGFPRKFSHGAMKAKPYCAPECTTKASPSGVARSTLRATPEDALVTDSKAALDSGLIACWDELCSGVVEKAVTEKFKVQENTAVLNACWNDLCSGVVDRTVTEQLKATARQSLSEAQEQTGIVQQAFRVNCFEEPACMQTLSQGSRIELLKQRAIQDIEQGGFCIESMREIMKTA